MFLNKSVLIKTATKKYLKENIFTVGLFPVIDQGQTYINGYVNETSFLIPKNEYLIFGDHTEIFKFVNFSFCQGGDGLKIIECNSNFFSLRFLFYSLVSNYKIVGGYSRHFKYLVETKISIPSAFQEQQKIADFLSTIDEQAESLKNQLSNIQEMKKYYLRSLFF
jgi:type I restriction enzyme S subunit